jgi:MFS family permease
MIVSGSYAAVSVAWNGLIADMCPDDLRGFASGMAGLFTLLGYGAGALWNVFYRDIGVWGTYIFVSIIFFLAVLVSVLSAKEESSVGKISKLKMGIILDCTSTNPTDHGDSCRLQANAQTILEATLRLGLLLGVHDTFLHADGAVHNCWLCVLFHG